ncbi:MAG TPA: 4-hydroxybenzoate octaprenyltransferase [Patescibacteria group bacterium]|jgi:4-hydroxybenzoate polyprenyltransferase|nr:4-hydroxybenzoate octaprenyltransferase [Patescibacteria group bacterium]
MTHTDIRTDGWIGRWLPPAAQPYALLARLDRPVGTWLLLLPGWWGIVLAVGRYSAMNARDEKTMILFGVGAVVMRAAGCVINDLWDRDFDRRVERTMARPLAAGTVTPKQALAFLAVLLLIGFWILTQMSLVTILLGILSLPLIVIYPLAKRFTWWPQLVLGLIFNFGALMGWGAVTGAVGLPALLLYAAGIFWTLGYDTIYAHQDIADDMKIGVRSTAIKFGPDSKKWVAGFYAAAWVLILLAFIAAHENWQSFVFLLFPAMHFAIQIKMWDPNDPAKSLEVFRMNRILGFLVLLAAAL